MLFRSIYSLASFAENRNFEEKDLENIDFAVAATDDKMLNKKIACLCRNKKIPVNSVTDLNDCDFVFPAVYRNKDVVVGISTGGKSYPNTGSDGMMYEILKKYGHTINKIYPALIPLTVKESFIKKLQGISMRNVEISCKIKKKKIFPRPIVLSAAEGDKYGTGKKRMQGGALSDWRQTLLCRWFSQPFGRLRDTQQALQGLHSTEGHHPHTAGTAEGDLLPLRGLHGLPLLPHPAAGKMSRPPRA